MSSRKELRNSIDRLEVKIQMEKARLAEHQQYFTELMNDNKYLLLALLVPTFLAGWRAGKKIKTGKQRGWKRFAKFMLGTTLATIRKPTLLIKN